MLVLKRKVGESIIIDSITKVTVLAIEGGKVKIGIEAPKGVSIVREELLKADDIRLQ